MNIAIMYGGKSGEHEVSLASASSIARHIPKDKNAITLIGIAKDGAWYLQDEANVDAVRADPTATLSIDTDERRRVSVVPGGGAAGAFRVEGKPLPIDVVFPVLHGTFGEDGTIQGLFEMADVPYVGAGVMASSVAMDKEKTKVLWQAAGLPVVPFIAVKAHAWRDETERRIIVLNAEKDFSYPMFVKPVCAGSSVGAAKAANRDELERRVGEAFLWDNKTLIEPFIPALEVECSVTGNEAPIAYTPGQIVPSHEFYDYDAKYTDPNGASLKIPADIDENANRRVRTLAVQAYRALDLSGCSRVDFFVDKRNQTLYLNEINTIPGFTSISMFPKMCEASGLPYPELIMRLISLAKARYDERKGLQTSRA